MCDSGMILKGEILCYSFLGVKRMVQSLITVSGHP